MKERTIKTDGCVYWVSSLGDVWLKEPAQPAVPPCKACVEHPDGGTCGSLWCGGRNGHEALPERALLRARVQKAGNRWQVAWRGPRRADGSRQWTGETRRGIGGWLVADNPERVLADDRLTSYRTLADALVA